MTLKSIFKALKKALPVIVTNAPAVIAIAQEIRKAVAKPRVPAPE